MEAVRKRQCRAETRDGMKCHLCGAQLLIVSSGLVCERACGRIIPASVFRQWLHYPLHELRAAWPDRLIRSPADKLA